MSPHDDISHLAFVVSYGEILNVYLLRIADFIEDCISIYLMGGYDNQSWAKGRR